jgi:hypothetical protein
VRVKVA